MRGAQERTAALERTLPVARSFQEQLSPLVEWLEQTERRLTAMSTLPTDADRLTQRAQEHRELHRDVLGHKRAFEALTETAQQLMSLVGDDEAQAVVDSLQELTDRYARLVGDSERLEQLLTEARAGAGAFALAFEDLLVWIGEMESRLARYQVLSVYVEKLQEQFDELNVSVLSHGCPQPFVHSTRTHSPHCPNHTLPLFFFLHLECTNLGTL